jgi:hypothetical protein
MAVFSISRTVTSNLKGAISSRSHITCEEAVSHQGVKAFKWSNDSSHFFMVFGNLLPLIDSVIKKLVVG